MSLISRIRAWRAPRQVSVADMSPFAGYVDELSPHHVAGWLTGPGPKDIVAALPDGAVVATGTADQFKFGPSHAGQGHHGFYTRFTRTLSPPELAVLTVRAPDGTAIERRPDCSGEYRPVVLNAMDIVDNCNLRCPFCMVDYSRTFDTNVMTEETFEAALRLMPFTGDSNFWFSCLHEPTLHPRFAEFLAAVPAEHRKRVFFTSNFAKRMPPEYFALLANGGFGTLNISIESMEPAIYERMRKGARFRIFMANWDALIAAFAGGSAPPLLRYIVMVYKSNLAEVPALANYLLAERRADEIQLRFTFDLPHIPAAFRESEYVTESDWDWLAAQVADHPPGKVQVIRAPGQESGNGEGVFMPGRYELKLSWDGTLKVNRFWSVPFEAAGEAPVKVLNVRDIEDWPAFFGALT